MTQCTQRSQRTLRSKIAQVSFAVLIALGSANAQAGLALSSLSGLGQSQINTMIQTVGIAADHHAYMPASALGMTLGFDIGIDVTYFALPSAFAAALASAAGQTTSQIPSGLPIPKLNIHKGLAFGIDLGASFTSFTVSGQTITSGAGEAKWTFINNVALPAVAARASYSVNSVDFLNANTFNLGVLVSKNLVVLEPYAGAGMQFWSGSLSVPSTVTPPAGIKTSASGTNFDLLGGLMFSMTIFKLDAEVDYSTAGITSFGGKVSIGF